MHRHERLQIDRFIESNDARAVVANGDDGARACIPEHDARGFP
jgi:hypothetical protein